MVQVFRRQDSYFESARLPLRGLKTDARYRVENLSADRTIEMTGRELMEKGLHVAIEDLPGAAVFAYTEMQ